MGEAVALKLVTLRDGEGLNPLLPPGESYNLNFLIPALAGIFDYGYGPHISPTLPGTSASCVTDDNRVE